MSIKVSTTAKINGLEVPIMTWKTSLGSYGSIGSASITTSRRMLANKNLEVYDLAANSGPKPEIPVDIMVTLGTNQANHYFGGVLDGITTDHDEDVVSITARDFASEMIDTRRVLNLKEYVNRTPSQIASALANDFGLVPKVTATPGGVLAGSFFQRDAVLTKQPRPVWTTLVWLAQQIGFQVYVTPDKELVFSPVDEGLDPIQFVWKPSPNTPAGIVVKDLVVRHSIKRNRSFKVKVLSYHPKSTQMISSEVVMLGETITLSASASAGKKRHMGEGYYRGIAGKNAASELKSAGVSIPTYTFNYSGLTPDQCKAKAESIAENIAQKLFTINACMDGRTDLKIHQPVKISGDVDRTIIGKTFFVTSIEGKYQQPSGGGESSSAGFTTDVILNTLPPASTEDSGSIIS